MKTRRTVYIIIGSLLLVLNLLVDLVELSENKWDPGDGAAGIGYIIGSHIFVITGLIFLRLAYTLHKKIRAKDEDHSEEIENIGKE
ncbi:MAG: hypothetical protein ABIO79_06055 [Ferruginibacter sp.]